MLGRMTLVASLRRCLLWDSLGGLGVSEIGGGDDGGVKGRSSVMECLEMGLDELSVVFEDLGMICDDLK